MVIFLCFCSIYKYYYNYIKFFNGKVNFSQFLIYCIVTVNESNLRYETNMKNIVTVNNETSKEEVFNIAKELINNGIYNFIINNENETLLHINAFHGATGLSEGKYAKHKHDFYTSYDVTPWCVFCRENTDMWKSFDNLSAKEYKRLAKEQLDENEYFIAQVSWIDDINNMDEDSINNIERCL